MKENLLRKAGREDRPPNRGCRPAGHCSQARPSSHLRLEREWVLSGCSGCGGRASCGPAKWVSLGFRVGFRAAADTFPVNILSGDLIAVGVQALLGRRRAITAVGSRCNLRGRRRAGAGNRSRRGDRGRRRGIGRWRRNRRIALGGRTPAVKMTAATPANRCLVISCPVLQISLSSKLPALCVGSAERADQRHPRRPDVRATVLEPATSPRRVALSG